MKLQHKKQALNNNKIKNLIKKTSYQNQRYNQMEIKKQIKNPQFFQHIYKGNSAII